MVCIYRQPMSNEYIQPVLGREGRGRGIYMCIGMRVKVSVENMASA